MKTLIIIALSLFVIVGLLLWQLKTRSFKKRLSLLAKNSHLVSKDGDKEIYPTIKFKKKWLFIRNYNPLINQLNFDSKLLTSFSNLYETNFLKADYQNKCIVLKSSKARSVSFSKSHPQNLDPYNAYCGMDEDGLPFIFNLFNRCSVLIGGEMGTGKSILADRIHHSLVRTSGEAKSYFLCKNRNDFSGTDKSVFIQKDDKDKMLWHLNEIRLEVLERQKEIEAQNCRSAFDLKLEPIYIIADEVHSYGNTLNSSYPAEEREKQGQIISILKFLLLQGRSSLVYIIFITPNLEKDQTDLNLRDCAFYFSTRINSEELGRNLFGNSIPFLMPREVGLFAFTDKNQTKVLKVAHE